MCLGLHPITYSTKLIKYFAILCPTVSVEVKTDECLENMVAILISEIFFHSFIYSCLLLQAFDLVFNTGTTLYLLFMAAFAWPLRK